MPPKTTPGKDSRADTRQRIADAALGLFTTKGFAGTPVRQIAEDVQLTVPALYYHFDSKDGLLAALVEPLVIDGEQLLEELATLNTSQRPNRALAGYYDVVTRNLGVFRFVMTDPSVRSHDLAGHRLADQASRFLHLLVGPRPSRLDLIRASAALGAIRRPLRLPEVDIEGDRRQILASARAALRARP